VLLPCITTALKPAETCHLVFHALTMLNIVIRARLSSFVADLTCFRIPLSPPYYQWLSGDCNQLAITLGRRAMPTTLEWATAISSVTTSP